SILCFPDDFVQVFSPKGNFLPCLDEQLQLLSSIYHVLEQDQRFSVPASNSSSYHREFSQKQTTLCRMITMTPCRLRYIKGG
ncbi:hypothetical protein PMAYCL1PPCAC_27949, partial [Pristionchus mayeri]